MQACETFKGQLNETSKALTAVLPVGGFVLLRKLAILHVGHSAGAGSGAGSSGAGAGSRRRPWEVPQRPVQAR